VRSFRVTQQRVDSLNVEDVEYEAGAKPAVEGKEKNTFYFPAPFNLFWTRGRTFAPAGTRDVRCSGRGLCVHEGAAPGDVARDGVSQRMEY